MSQGLKPNIDNTFFGGGVEGWRGGGWRAKIELQGTPGAPREKSPCSGPPKTKILRARRADMPHLNDGVRQELEHSSLLGRGAHQELGGTALSGSEAPK